MVFIGKTCQFWARILYILNQPNRLKLAERCLTFEYPLVNSNLILKEADRNGLWLSTSRNMTTIFFLFYFEIIIQQCSSRNRLAKSGSISDTRYCGEAALRNVSVRRVSPRGPDLRVSDPITGCLLYEYMEKVSGGCTDTCVAGWLIVELELLQQKMADTYIERKYLNFASKKQNCKQICMPKILFCISRV